jgi:hypothetical protein
MLLHCGLSSRAGRFASSLAICGFARSAHDISPCFLPFALIGADLTNLDKVRGLGAPVASIGGAGTFDGIFLTGILAVLFSGFYARSRVALDWHPAVGRRLVQYIFQQFVQEFWVNIQKPPISKSFEPPPTYRK